jgi:hypothetical protein
LISVFYVSKWCLCESNHVRFFVICKSFSVHESIHDGKNVKWRHDQKSDCKSFYEL